MQIRGYRVEIAEVETAVRSLEGVREAVVVAHDTAQMPDAASRVSRSFSHTCRPG